MLLGSIQLLIFAVILRQLSCVSQFAEYNGSSENLSLRIWIVFYSNEEQDLRQRIIEGVSGTYSEIRVCVRGACPLVRNFSILFE